MDWTELMLWEQVWENPVAVLECLFYVYFDVLLCEVIPALITA